MRAFRSAQGIREANPFPQASPASIFSRRHQNDARDADQTEAHKLANQLAYSNPAYSWDGKAGPSFFGYLGMGYGGVPLGFSTTSNVKNFTPSLFKVPANQPTEQWLYVKANGEAQPAGTSENLQGYFNAVPTPNVAHLTVAGGLTATGTDGEVCIYRPATDEYWEVFGFDRPTPAGGHTFQYGGYIPNFSTWNGVFPTLGNGQVYGARASGIMAIGGTITWQDLIEVLRGGKIKHALSIGVMGAAGPSNLAHRAPAKRNDTRENVFPKLADGITPNPAFGTIDCVREGLWCCFPKASSPAEYGITRTLEVAVYEAIREYGLVVNDVSGANAFSWEYPGALGSRYSWAAVNPLAGDTDFVALDAEIPGSWTDASLPILSEHLSGTASIYAKQPWQTLESVVPFAG